MRRAAQKAQARTEDTRQRIIEAALLVFAERGFAGASTRDIAAAADANQGLIAYHFGSKEALWQAAVHSLFETLQQEIGAKMAAVGDLDPATQLGVLIKHFVRFSAAHPELNRLMMQEGMRDGPRLKWIIDEHVRPIYQFSTELIRRGQAAGSLPDVDPLHLHYILLGAATHLFTMAPEVRHLSRRDASSEALVEAHADAVVRILIESPGASGMIPSVSRFAAKTPTRRQRV